MGSLESNDADERLRITRELWSSYRERGPEAGLASLHPDVAFIAADGHDYHGHDGVREFFRQFDERGYRFTASPFTFEPHGDDLMVVGHYRIRTPQGQRGGYLYFVHSFRDGLISRLSAHRRREDALADIASRAER